MYLERVSCCGLREAEDVGVHETPEEALQDLCANASTADPYGRSEANQLFQPSLGGFSHIVFTGAAATSRRTYADKLAAYIRRHKLGAVTTARKARNPNSGNILGVYVWTVNRRVLAAWYKKHPINEED